MFASISVVAIALAAGASAQFAGAPEFTQPDASFPNNPSGNAIFTPGLGQTVQAGAPFEVTWGPTTEGTVTIYVCVGPAENCVARPRPFADKVPNSGSFLWNVSPNLPASTVEGQGFGLILIADATGQYQFSTQFGIANPNPPAVSSSASSSAIEASSSAVESTVVSTEVLSSATETAVSTAVETHPAPPAETHPAPPAETHPAPVSTLYPTYATYSTSLFATPTGAIPTPPATGAGAAFGVKSGLVAGAALAAVAMF